jgi:4-amino-4-deoxy-L-arabinose transferase-like glycosyltransferase
LTERQAATRRRARQHWALLAIILLAFVLRVYDLGRAPLWFDEALSGVIAAKSAPDIVAHTVSTPFEHPPLYYLALHLWVILAGSSGFALRFFSLFWGVLLSPLLYRFLAPWGGNRLVMLTVLLTAVSVTHVDHSQSARMYTLIAALGVLSLLYFFRGLEGRQRRWWVGYLLVTGVGIAIHYYFALLLFVPLTFLLLSGPRYRRVLILFIAIMLGVGLLAASWLWLSPGPRQAMQQILRSEGAGVSSLALRVKYTIGGLLLEEPTPGPLLLGVLALLGLFSWPLPRVPRNHPLSRVGSRCFLLVWLVVPWMAALAIPYWLQSRHLAYLWPALYALAACGLLALSTKRTWLFVLGLLLVASTSVYGLHRQDQVQASRPDYGRIMTYIQERALPADLVILNQPSMWPFVDYYTHRDLKIAYVPRNSQFPSAEQVSRRLESLVENQSRIWLGPISAWTADPESLVERWLAAHTFQADKAWFPESSSAALYFTADGEMLPVEIGQLVWGERILLQNLYAGPLRVEPGDAVRLRFGWRAGFDLGERYVVELALVDDMGKVWAERRSEPCGDWCPTDTWSMAHQQQDQHALLVPPGTPPGIYHVQVSWVPLGGGPALSVEVDGQRQERIALLDVTVLPAQPGTDTADTLLARLQASFGEEITLQSYDLAPTEALPGQLLHLEAGWRAAKRPAGNYSLRVELVDERQRPSADWEFSPSASFYPTGLWQPGQYLRGEYDLPLPNTLSPGRYRLRLAIVNQAGERLPLSGERPRQALGGLISWQEQLTGEALVLSTIQLNDRPRHFDLPPMEHELAATVGQQAHLVGYDLVTSRAYPGGQVFLTLYWHADGPMAEPFKVFTHLVDGEGVIVAQHDAAPGGGCCPANTWAAGEIIVDEHPIALKADLLPGSYQLVAGMYNEESDSRLPAYAADGSEFAEDRIPIGSVVVEPAKVAGQATLTPAAPKFELEHKIFLPLVGKGK